MAHILFILQTKNKSILFGILTKDCFVYQIGYLLILICRKPVYIFTYGLCEILTVVLTPYCRREIIPVSPVDIFGAASGAPIDCINDYIKYAGSQKFCLFALCEKHSYVQKSPETE